MHILAYKSCRVFNIVAAFNSAPLSTNPSPHGICLFLSLSLVPLLVLSLSGVSSMMLASHEILGTVLIDRVSGLSSVLSLMAAIIRHLSSRRKS